MNYPGIGPLDGINHGSWPLWLAAAIALLFIFWGLVNQLLIKCQKSKWSRLRDMQDMQNKALRRNISIKPHTRKE